LILAKPTFDMTEDAYLAYTFNRFQACRFGLQGEIIDPVARERKPLSQDIRETVAAIRQSAFSTDDEPLREIERSLDFGNDAAWLRARFAESGSLGVVVAAQAARFAGDARR
jgi:carboxylate-amine ligase